MDWKIFFTTFLTIFIAELGDKTQFTALALSSQSKSTFSVWLAVVTALTVAGSIGVLAGRVLSQYINPQTLRYAAGGLFIVFGLWILLKK